MKFSLRRSAPCARQGFSRGVFRAQGALLHVVLLAVLLAFAGNALAVNGAIDPLPFKDHAQELRFQHLTGQLRCLVCQDESLADSNADLARDMRLEVFQLMQSGKTDAQIKQYLVDRYGDYVLYKPPLKPSTWLLWFGPLLILIAGGVVVAVAVHRRKRHDDPHDNNLTDAGETPADTGDDW